MPTSRLELEDRRDAALLLVMSAAACLLILLGISIMTGALARSVWPDHSPPFPDYMGMPVSQAFIASGFGLLAASWGARRLALLAGALVLLISGASLGDAMTDARLGLEALLWRGAGRPGSAAAMEPMVSFTFVCAGLQLMGFAASSEERPRIAPVLELLSFVVFTLSAQGLIVGLFSPLAAGNRTGVFAMAPPVAAGLLILGTGLLGLAWYRRERQREGISLWILALLFSAVLILDIVTPRGVAVALAYIPLVFCGLWFNRAYIALLLAAVATILGLAGVFAEPPSDMEWWLAVSNRATVIAAVWLVAILVYLRRYSETALRESEAMRWEAEAKNALLAAVVQSSDHIIISKTLDGIITSWNPTAERLLGYTAEEAIGRHVNFIVPPERYEEEAQLLAGLVRGQMREHLETKRLRKDGRGLDISITVSPVKDARGRIIGASTIGRDITEEKRAAEQIRHYTQELERSNQDLEDFAYTASHDLREPLRGIASNAQLLGEEYARGDESGLARIRRIKFLSKRMDRLIDDLLQYSRLSRKHLQMERIDLRQIVGEILAEMKGTLETQNVTVSVTEPFPPVTCDRRRMTDVFRNLIENAIKYNDKTEKLIEIGCIENMETAVGRENVYYVRDNGQGIDELFYEEVFRIFKRLNYEDESKRGSGAGLTFTRKIVRLHGGRIWVTSKLGAGSTFFFTFGQSAQMAQAA